MATATVEIVTTTRAIVTVDYARGGFGMQRVETPRAGGDLYERAYNAASVMATIQGERLETFRREE
jgi:hypothetical protein